MSLRLSACRPFACSGDMYAAVPRSTPTPVTIAGLVIVGDSDWCVAASAARLRCQRLGQPEVQHFHRAVGPQLDIRGLEIAMDDALLVRRFEGLCDLLRDRQRFVERDRPARDALREILTLDEFHHQRADAAGFFEAVNVRDRWMVQRRERLRLAL